jgi:hypothetical protein
MQSNSQHNRAGAGTSASKLHGSVQGTAPHVHVLVSLPVSPALL